MQSSRHKNTHSRSLQIQIEFAIATTIRLLNNCSNYVQIIQIVQIIPSKKWKQRIFDRKTVTLKQIFTLQPQYICNTHIYFPITGPVNLATCHSRAQWILGFYSQNDYLVLSSPYFEDRGEY